MNAHSSPNRSRGAAIALAGCLLVGQSARLSAEQQSVNDVLSFLLINRSIATDDFVQDEEATLATRDTISSLLLAEVSTFPLSSSAGGFAYRLDRTLGTVVRSSDSFGPFFTERSLTVGRGHVALGLSYQRAIFDNIDGRSLRDGTMVATASRLRGNSEPFDVETLSLNLRSETFTLSNNVGVTDRLDLGAAVSLVRIVLSGQRIDTYRGQQFLQATASASASGMGDLVIRAKYNVVRLGASGLAIGGEASLPTGDEDNLLGSGDATVRPRLIGSFERDRLAIHGNVAYSLGGPANELNYSGAVTIVGAQRLTFVAEIAGRRRESFGRLTETVTPHPSLAGVDTIRLSSVAQETNRLVAVAGVKWNVGGTWLLNANILRPLTSVGLNARWVPTLTFDYSFGQ